MRKSFHSEHQLITGTQYLEIWTENEYCNHIKSPCRIIESSFFEYADMKVSSTFYA